MSDWLEHSDNANTLKSSYIQGVLDVSGDIIMRNSDQAFINMSDATFNRKFHALKNTAIGKEVDNLENALDISGNVGITGSLVLEETPTIYSGSLNTDQLSIEGNLFTTGGTAQVASKNVTYDTHLNVHGSTITANTSELNHMHKHLNKNNYLPEELLYMTLSSANETGLKLPFGLSYDGNIMSLRLTSSPTIVVYQYMTLTQDEWDARTKTTTIAHATPVSNTIITSDSSLDTTKKYWTQLGANIDENGTSTGSGGIVLSGNGECVITETASSSIADDFVVYRYSTPGLLGGTWDRISSTFSHDLPSNYGAYNLTTNYSGNRFAFCYMQYTESGYTNSNTGKVYIFEYSGSGTTWNSIGTILGTDQNWSSNFAEKLAMNRSTDPNIDGTVLCLNHHSNPVDGKIGDNWAQVYDYSDGNWVARPNIYGWIPQVFAWSTTTAEQTNYYQQIDVTNDGNYIILSSIYSLPNRPAALSETTTNAFGNCIVFEYRLITQTEWDNGNTSTDYTPAEGVPVIMADGDTSLDTNKKYWIQKGDCIVPPFNLTYAPYLKYGKIRSHADGTLFVTLTMLDLHTDTLSDCGAVLVYAFENTNWSFKQIYYGTNSNQELGEYDLAVSGDGTRFLTGSFNSPYVVLIQDIGYTPEIQYKYQIHNDVSMVNAAESFGEDVSLNAALTVPGNILIVDSSNSEYNYGAYTIHTDETYTNYFAVGKSASNVFNIVNNNNAGVYMDSGSNSFTGTSDERLKKNIEEIGDESNEKVKQLRPVTYQWKHQTHDKSQAGFIAQEVEKVLPELVKENDSVDGSSYKGVSSDDLIPYLVKYVQKLRKKLEILKETKLKKNVSLSEISVSTNGGSITPSPFSSTDELK